MVHCTYINNITDLRHKAQSEQCFVQQSDSSQVQSLTEPDNVVYMDFWSAYVKVQPVTGVTGVPHDTWRR